MDYKRLDEVANIIMGQSPDSDSYNEMGEGVPFFQGNADFGEIYPTTRLWCKRPIKLVDKDTLLISVRAPIGALNFSNGKCCIGRGLAGITSKEDVCIKYIYYCMKSKYNELNRKGTGSTFKAISKVTLAETKIKMVSLTEQRKCVEVLDGINKIIYKRKEQLQELDKLIKSRFVEMFGDPIQNSKQFETIIGENFFKLSNGKTIPAEKRKQTGIPAYGGNGISWYTDDVLFEKDTLVVGRVGFQSGNVHLVYGPLWITDNAMYISKFHVDEYDLTFLCALMEHINFTRFQDAGDLKKITQNPFMQMEYIFPPIEMQHRYSNFVHYIDKLKVVIQNSLSQTQLLFDSLMQEYFG